MTTYYVIAEKRNHPTPVPLLHTIDTSRARVELMRKELRKRYPKYDLVIQKSNDVTWGKA